MSHNVPLPAHRYVWVDRAIVSAEPGPRIPALWFGLSSTAGRAFGHHVLLDSGATILDLPPHAIAFTPNSPSTTLHRAQAWDCFGEHAHATHWPTYTGLPVRFLDRQHHETGDTGHHLGLAVDWTHNGYSDCPEQHKWLWAIQRTDGTLTWQPQDYFLTNDPSFTDGPPVRIIRQSRIWSVEA